MTYDPHGVIESVDRIYADDKHNTCPDIVWWRDAAYVVFSSGSHHLMKDHVGVILRSTDMQTWEKVYTSPYLTRDTTLLALPDKLLLHYVFFDYPEMNEPGYLQRRLDSTSLQARAVHTAGSVESMVSTSNDGETWTDPIKTYGHNQNIWRPVVHDGYIWTATDYIDPTGVELEHDGWYHGGGPPELSRVDLLRSTDGLEWEFVSRIINGGGHTETEILFRPDGELWAISRPATFARSRPPYTEWRYDSLPDGRCGGPAMIACGNEVYLGGRHYGLGENIWGTALWRYSSESDNFEHLAVLPEPGNFDLSYPGFIQHDDKVYMVYYSSHLRERKFQSGRMVAAKADIFLAKLSL